MKSLLAAILLTIAAHASAEVFVTPADKSVTIPVIPEGTKLFVRCARCPANFLASIKDHAINLGYDVKDNPDEMDMAIALFAEISQPSLFGAAFEPWFYSFGADKDPLPPAIKDKSELASKKTGMNMGGSIDAGATKDGYRYTGTAAGAAGFAIGASILGSLFEKIVNDPGKTSGVTKVLVVYGKRGSTKSEISRITFIAAADTTEIPEALLLGAVNGSLDIIKNGYSPEPNDAPSNTPAP